MSTKFDHLTSLIKDQIRNFEPKTEAKDVGHVISISDGVATISSIEGVMQSEVLLVNKKTRALALSLQTDCIIVSFLDDYQDVIEGHEVQRTNQTMSVPVGNQLLGRIVSATGQPIDGGKPIDSKKTRPIERVASGVMARKAISKPLATGILAIDALIPIGKGQRELIIGDRQTGKTSIAVDTIINQKNRDVYCVYVAIGQKNSTIVNIHETLKALDAMTYTTIVASNASDLPAMQYIAPYSGMAIAEEWMEEGKDVLIVFDDLSKHAVAYRTISLLLKRPPGREAYPGDVFYLHSRLLERAASMDPKYGGGSITALPIIETQSGDISAYIPTNVISITDGQIFMNSGLFNAGQRPAIDISLSVSRVGSAAQIKAVKQTAGSLKLALAQHKDLEAFASFGSDVDEETRETLNHGNRILQILKQHRSNPYDQVDQSIILLAIQEKIIRWIPVLNIRAFKTKVINHYKTDPLGLKKEIIKQGQITPELRQKLKKELVSLVHEFVQGIPDYVLRNAEQFDALSKILAGED